MTDPHIHTQPLDCPSCGEPSEVSQTKYGRRDSCQRCGLHSWDGKPMVSQAVHDARQHCHAAFDRLWKTAHELYTIEEAPGTPERERMEKRLCRTQRNRAYRYISFITGLPEPECHMAGQQDIEKLRLIWRAARDVTPGGVRDWWKSSGAEWWATQVAVEKAEKRAERVTKKGKAA